MYEQARWRLKQYYLLAHPTNKELGMRWYSDANAIGLYVAIRLGVTHDQVFRIIARLSPRVRWHANVKQAILLFVLGERAGITTYKQNKRKALAMRDDPCLHDLGVEDQKISAFYHNLQHPETSQRVTLDTWMLDKVMGLPFNHTHGRKYREIERIVQDVAKEVDVLPHQLQAIVWLEARSGRNIPLQLGG